MMSRPRHPDKDIERTAKYAESLGWTVKMSTHGHAWGHLYCPQSTREGCIISVWSTPRNPESHARRVQRGIDLCPHNESNAPQGQTEEEEDGDQDIV